MPKTGTYTRILAVYPTRRGFGFAILEGKAKLVDWGVAKVWATSEKEFLARVEAYVDRYRPVAIVLANVTRLRQAGAGARRNNLLAEFARERRIPLVFASRDDVRTALQMPGAVKLELARALASLFPALEVFVPPPRKPWMSEDERMSVFEAVGMIVAATARRGPE